MRVMSNYTLHEKSFNKIKERKLEDNHSFIVLKTIWITFSKPIKFGLPTTTLVSSTNSIVLGTSLQFVLIVTLGRSLI